MTHSTFLVARQESLIKRRVQAVTFQSNDSAVFSVGPWGLPKLEVYNMLLAHLFLRLGYKSPYGSATTEINCEKVRYLCWLIFLSTDTT